MKGLTKWLTAIIFVISACATAQVYTATDVSGNIVPLGKYRPPAVYEIWWSEIARCENLPLPEAHRNVDWIVVPTRPFRFVGPDSTAYDAVTLTPNTRIYVNKDGIFDRGLITHEMTHYLLFEKFGQRYVGKHPQPYYSNCGLVREGQQPL